MLHAILDWLHAGLCRVGLHDWSYTYARDWDDDKLRQQCVRCGPSVERVRGKQQSSEGKEND